MADVVDWDAEGLLEGLDDAARGERVRLLEELAGGGVSLEELHRAVSEGRLAALPAELVLGGAPRWSAREVSEKSGMDLDFMLTLRRANGGPIADPDDPSLSDTDIQLNALTSRLRLTGVTDEQIEETTRVMSGAIRPVADAMTAVIFELSYDPELSESDLAARFSEQVAQVAPFVGPIIEANLVLHLRAAVREAAVAAAERAAIGGLPGTRDITVAFADLVGFTRLGEEIPPGDLERVAYRLGVLVADMLRPPVRFVKTIGDSVMLVSPDAAALLDMTSDLMAAADALGDALPQLRAGFASGPAVARGGDWYGSPVNLASRITSIARAGSILATRDVRDAVGNERFRWSSAGARSIRGIPDAVPLYRARRL